MANRQVNLRGDLAEEGLPTAEDYDPDLLGTIEFEAGEPEQQWPEYGIELVPVMANSPSYEGLRDTGRRMVVRNGRYLSDVSEQYKLLPNERLVSVANEVADEMGAEPFHEFEGDWYIELDDHVFQDSDRRRVHGVYAWQPGEIDGDGMEYGFAVHNSIDGSLGFSVGLFSFRHACQNMVFLGTASSAEQRALRVESERGMLNQTQHQHTHGLAVEREKLKATIEGTLTLIDDVDATYEQWVSEVVTPSDVAGLLKRPQLARKDLPEWMQEVPEALEDVTEDEADEGEDLPWERQAEVISAEIPQASNVWETYNDLTQNIWHSGSGSDQTRRSKMKDVHRVFDPAEASDDDVTLR